MKMSKKEVAAKHKVMSEPSSMGDQYPYGLKLHFNDDEIKKLKVDLSKRNVGEVVNIIAMGSVSKVEESDEYGYEKTLGIQIKKISLEFSGTTDELDWGTDEKKAEKILEKRGLIK